MDLIFGDIHYRLGIGAHNGFLSIAGHLVGPNVQKLALAFRKASHELKGPLFVSLEGLKSVDSAALAVLVREKKALSERHCDAVFVDVPGPIMKLLDGAHLTSLFEIVPTLKEAEAKYGQALH